MARRPKLEEEFPLPYGAHILDVAELVGHTEYGDPLYQWKEDIE